MNDAIKQLSNQINQITSVEELKFLDQVIKMRWRVIAAAATAKALASGITYGARVSFSSKGELIEGNVIKVNNKTVHVKSLDGFTWKVSPTLLKIVP